MAPYIALLISHLRSPLSVFRGTLRRPPLDWRAPKGVRLAPVLLWRAAIPASPQV